MKLIKLTLFSKNNRKNGFYLYSPIVEVNGAYYWCETIKTNKVLNVKAINVNELKVTRQIPREFYAANNLTPIN